MVIVITGPTATGKTDLGIYLAHKLNGEIINADSTQIYKGLDIATNKVQDTEGIVHHLFNEKDLREDYSVFDYQKDARKAIDDILARGKVPILVGGTGLYINAALYDYKFENNALNIDLELSKMNIKLTNYLYNQEEKRKNLEKLLSYSDY